MKPREADRNSQNQSKPDLRSEPRHAVTTPAVVDVLGDEPSTMDAEVINVSASGMRLRTPRPVVADSALRIRLGADQYLGEVTHCRQNGDHYFVGLALFNVMRNADAVSKHFRRILERR